MSRTLPILLASTAAMALTSGAAFADDAATDTADVIVVEGRFLSLDQVNALKTPTPIIDVPQSFSIVSEVQIENQAFTSLADILRYTPGLAVSQGEGHRDAIIIRGNQTTADFFLNGVRDDVQYYRPLYNLEQVEILRGANALLFGRGGGGGVVNRVTKSPVMGDAFTAPQRRHRHLSALTSLAATPMSPAGRGGGAFA
jgi:catecholate siderophore receptor